MGSANSHKFLPSQWLKAMKHQFMSMPRTTGNTVNAAEYESKLSITSKPCDKLASYQPGISSVTTTIASNAFPESTSCDIVTDLPSTSETQMSLFPSCSESLVNELESSDLQSQSYIRRSQKFFSKKFLQSTSKGKRPYHYSKVHLHSSTQNGNCSAAGPGLTHPVQSLFDDIYFKRTMSMEQDSSFKSEFPDETFIEVKHVDDRNSKSVNVTKCFSDDVPTKSDFGNSKQDTVQPKVLPLAGIILIIHGIIVCFLNSVFLFLMAVLHPLKS